MGTIAIANGWESYITYARNHNPSKSHTIKIGNKFDILWHGLITRLFDRHCLCSKKATKKLIKEIDKINPDIIQLHHIHGYFLNMEILFEYLIAKKIPVVWIFHDCWAFTGHCAHFDYINCKKWKTGCFDCSLKISYPASLIIDRSKKNYELKKDLFTKINNLTIVSVSKWLDNWVKNSFLSNIPNTIIYNGVDVTVFSPEVVPNDKIKRITVNSKVLLGVASTWSERKGLKDFEMLSSLLPNNYTIILIG
ncbi:MAG: glycosyltransferase, partial [Muribaculaceae bacterium]